MASSEKASTKCAQALLGRLSGACRERTIQDDGGLTPDLLKHVAEELLFAGGVEVDGAFAEARLFGDGVDIGALEPPARELARRRL